MRVESRSGSHALELADFKRMADIIIVVKRQVESAE